MSESRPLYFSLVESNIFHLLDELLANKYTSDSNFTKVEINKDRVYFKWRDQDAVIEFNAQGTILHPWTFDYQHVIDGELQQMNQVACNYDIVVRLTELTSHITHYEVTNVKDGYGFGARIMCNFITETPHITFVDEKRKQLGSLVLNNEQYLDQSSIRLYKCNEVEQLTNEQILIWANDYNGRYKLSNWELAQVMWDISCKNKRPQDENNHFQSITRLNDEDLTYEDFDY